MLMKMWKESLGLIVCMSLALATAAGGSIVNEEEYQTLCKFVILTQRIRYWLKGMVGKSEAEVLSLQKKVNDILFGTGISDVTKMNWQPHREMDCGQDNPGKPFWAGETLVKDLLCLCERRNQQSPPGDLCYTAKKERYNSETWRSSSNHKKTWSELQNKCESGRSSVPPTRTEFQDNRKRLETGIKKRRSSGGREYYTYGGNKDKVLSVCDGQESETNGICVVYPALPNQGTTISIKWLSELEGLVERVEEMSKNANTDADTAATTTTKPITHTETDTNTNTQTKRSPGENSPAKGSDEPQKNGNPNARTTTSTTAAETTGTTRPPEEQKSFAKINSRSLLIFFCGFISHSIINIHFLKC
ncbi:variant surface glycoprotein [Trypanosoma brucei equiperdum]|uniref:Variant surface glycoprotein n=1 Tax=Trypanosoma brucei equiperdum TaxID=630700 RepID=A0A3L6L3C0_9TRYP|nr:variant surface glycoprotein [Trypanosoma brucei equiperdum]